MCFRRLLCVKIEIDQLQSVNCLILIHCLSVSYTKISHSRFALVIGSSLQLTSNIALTLPYHRHILPNLPSPKLHSIRYATQSYRILLKIVSMIRKYHNQKLQTHPWHREEEPHNNHETPRRQTRQSNQLSLPHRDDCKTRMDTK